MNLKIGRTETFWVKIYLAGDIEVAKQICRAFCLDYGACVTVSPCEYIYTGGQETGYVVGLINYPRFPSTEEIVMYKANVLAEKLIDGTCQLSASIETPKETIWLSRREEYNK